MLSFPIKPMLLQSAKEPFDSQDHIFEWKVDGIRCIMFYKDDKVRLQSKTGRDCTQAFPELWQPCVNADNTVLDGEITVFTDDKPDFESVMVRYLASSKNIDNLSVTKPATYIVWDILESDGDTIIDKPLLSRKQILNEVLEDSDYIKQIDWIDTDGVALWEAVKAHGLEGMVAKRKSSTYEFRRSSSWLKVKNYQEIVVNVIGYAKKDGAVLVGTESRVQGHAIGMQKDERTVMWELLNDYGVDKGNNIYLPPGVRGKVRFTSWTPKGKMRDCHWVKFNV